MQAIRELDLFSEGPLRARVGRTSLVAGIAAMACGLLVAAASGTSWYDVLGGWGPVAAFGAMLVALPAHELVHAAAFALLAPGCRVSFGASSGFLYVRADGAVLTRARALVVLLSPAVLVTAALAVAGMAVGGPGTAVLLAGLHLSSCAGDAVMSACALRCPGCTHVRDTDAGVDLLG